MKKLFTSKSITEGYSDKLCQKIANFKNLTSARCINCC